MSARIERLITSGTFSLDGGTWDVENNVWIVGDDSEAIIIDPAHSPEEIVRTVQGRTVRAIVLTHGHDDHISSVLDTQKLLADRPEQAIVPPIYLNEADEMLWQTVFPGRRPDEALHDGVKLEVAGLSLTALPTPGHTPGSTCLFIDEVCSDALPTDLGVQVPDAEKLPVLFSGDTLFSGGPGATGRSYSSFDVIIDSITNTILTLPDSTLVLTGHGDATTVGLERPDRDAWIKRGS